MTRALFALLALLGLGLLSIAHAAPPSPSPRTRAPSTPPPVQRPTPDARKATTRPTTRSTASTRPAAGQAAMGQRGAPPLGGRTTLGSAPPSSRPPFGKPQMPPFSKRLLHRNTFFWSQFIGMLFALGVVVLLIYLILRWAAQRAGLQTTGSGKLLRVCDRLSLESKKGLWVVEVAGQYLLLATHEQGVTFLDRVDAETVQAYLEPSGETQTGFWERLRRGKAPPASQTDAPQPQAPSSSTSSMPTDFEVVSDGQTSSSSSQ